MTHDRSVTRGRLGAAAVAFALVLSGAVAHATPAQAEELDQVIDPHQQQGTGQVVLPFGHADFGPTLGTGAWALQIHDDTSSPRYWRNPADVVFQAGDTAIMNVPDDPAFSFLEFPAGTPVHVVPQTEVPEVPWVGWNTQEPNVLNSLNLGATLRIHAIEGPGEVVVYLQGGNFGEPQPLWSTHEPFPQDAWIEVNTHTHANWVFSRPGVYLVDAEFTGDLVTGETMSARGTLRFAVGDATEPAAAFAAELSSATSETDAPAGSGGGADSDASANEGASGDDLTWYLVAGGAALLVIAVIAVALASARARKRARADRAVSTPTDSTGGTP